MARFHHIDYSGLTDGRKRTANFHFLNEHNPTEQHKHEGSG